MTLTRYWVGDEDWSESSGPVTQTSSLDAYRSIMEERKTKCWADVWYSGPDVYDECGRTPDTESDVGLCTEHAEALREGRAPSTREWPRETANAQTIRVAVAEEYRRVYEASYYSHGHRKEISGRTMVVAGRRGRPETYHWAPLPKDRWRRR